MKIILLIITLILVCSKNGDAKQPRSLILKSMTPKKPEFMRELNLRFKRLQKPELRKPVMFEMPMLFEKPDNLFEKPDNLFRKPNSLFKKPDLFNKLKLKEQQSIDINRTLNLYPLRGRYTH